MELLQQSSTIKENYRILHTLGTGGLGTTYAAENLKTKEKVAIKALSLERVNEWKAVELFEREAKILEQLDHPAIPSYLDYFQTDTENNRSFYLVQQLAPGKSLYELIESGWKPQIAEVKDIARQLLEILVYLQQFNPPIIHRDLKPQNIIRQSNGKIFLVDFGAVQDTYHHTVTGGSTVVGTFGYMAPEQFRGWADITTDLYGLGTTLLFLLTRQDPSELPQKNLKIQFRDRVCLARDFYDWLDRLLAPASEDRFASAQQALAVLTGKLKLTKSGVSQNKAPQELRISAQRTADRLTVTIPPALQYSNLSRVLILSLAIANPIFLLFTWIAVESNIFDLLTNNSWRQGGCYVLALIVLGVVNRRLQYLYRTAFGTTHLRIERDRLTIRRWFGKHQLHKSVLRQDTHSIQQLKIEHLGEPLIKNVLTVCSIEFSAYKLQLGLFLPLKEKKWLVRELKSFLSNT